MHYFRCPAFKDTCLAHFPNFQSLLDLDLPIHFSKASHTRYLLTLRLFFRPALTTPSLLVLSLLMQPESCLRITMILLTLSGPTRVTWPTHNGRALVILPWTPDNSLEYSEDIFLRLFFLNRLIFAPIVTHQTLMFYLMDHSKTLPITFSVLEERGYGGQVEYLTHILDQRMNLKP